jgi:hypothetical protein
MAVNIPLPTKPFMPDMHAFVTWLITAINTQVVAGTTPSAWDPNS